jgi:hypothetical protein
MDYKTLLNKLIPLANTKFRLYTKKDYFMVQFFHADYHITIYSDQWDLYQKQTGLPYHLFHISSNKIDPKCSTYFWVDIHTNQIKHIPSKYFLYGQESYGYNKSTRFPCEYYLIKPLLKRFQKLLLSSPL